MQSASTGIALTHNEKAVASPAWLGIPGLLHGTTTRPALPGSGRFDIFEAVSLLRLQSILPNRLTLGGDQIHGETIAVIDRPIQFGGHPAGFRWDAQLQVGEFSATDALVTSIPGVILAIRTADCVPVLLVDREARIVGAAHCGWKGTIANLAAKTARAMVDLGASASRLEAWIGPSIRACHYEVGVDLVGRFQNVFPGVSLSPDGMALDLAAAVRAQLENAGVPASQILDSEECTMENRDRYHSHRADTGNAGRMISYISITPED